MSDDDEIRAVFKEAVWDGNEGCVDAMCKLYSASQLNAPMRNHLRVLGTKIFKYFVVEWCCDNFGSAQVGRLAMVGRKAQSRWHQALLGERWLGGGEKKSTDGEDVKFKSQVLLAILCLGSKIPAIPEAASTSVQHRLQTTHAVITLKYAARVVTTHLLSHFDRTINILDYELVPHFCIVMTRKREKGDDGKWAAWATMKDVHGENVALDAGSGHADGGALDKFADQACAEESLTRAMLKKVFAHCYETHEVHTYTNEDGDGVTYARAEVVDTAEDEPEVLASGEGTDAELARHAAICSFLEGQVGCGRAPFQRSEESDDANDAARPPVPDSQKQACRQKLFKKAKFVMRTADNIDANSFMLLSSLYANVARACPKEVEMLRLTECGLLKLLIEADFLGRFQIIEETGAPTRVRALYNHTDNRPLQGFEVMSEEKLRKMEHLLLCVGKRHSSASLLEGGVEGLELSPHFLLIGMHPDAEGSMARAATEMSADRDAKDYRLWVRYPTEVLIEQGIVVRQLSLSRENDLYCIPFADNEPDTPVAKKTPEDQEEPEEPAVHKRLLRFPHGVEMELYDCMNPEAGFSFTVSAQKVQEALEVKDERRKDNTERGDAAELAKKAVERTNEAKRILMRAMTEKTIDVTVPADAEQDVDAYARRLCLKRVERAAEEQEGQVRCFYARGLHDELCNNDVLAGLNAEFHDRCLFEASLRSSAEATQLNLVDTRTGLLDDFERLEFLGDAVLDLSVAMDCWYADEQWYAKEDDVPAWKCDKDFFQASTENGHREEAGTVGLLPIIKALLQPYLHNLHESDTWGAKKWADRFEAIIGAVRVDSSLGMSTAHNRVRYLSAKHSRPGNLYHREARHARIFGPAAVPPPLMTFEDPDKPEGWRDVSEKDPSSRPAVKRDRGAGGSNGMRTGGKDGIMEILQGMTKTGRLKELASSHFRFQGMSSSYVRAFTASEVHARMLHWHAKGPLGVGFTNERLTTLSKVAMDLDEISAEEKRFREDPTFADWTLAEVIHHFIANHPKFAGFGHGCTTSILLDISRKEKASQHFHWPNLSISLDDMKDMAAELQKYLCTLDLQTLQKENPSGWQQKISDERAAALKTSKLSLKEQEKLQQMPHEEFQLSRWAEYVDAGVYESRKLRMYLSDKCMDDDINRKGCPVRQKRVYVTPGASAKPATLSYFLDPHNSHPEAAVPIPHFDMLRLASLRHPTYLMDYRHSFIQDAVRPDEVLRSFWTSPDAEGGSVQESGPVDTTVSDYLLMSDLHNMDSLFATLVVRGMVLVDENEEVLPSGFASRVKNPSFMTKASLDAVHRRLRLPRSSHVRRLHVVCAEVTEEDQVPSVYYRGELWRSGKILAYAERGTMKDALDRVRVQACKVVEPFATEQFMSQVPSEHDEVLMKEMKRSKELFNSPLVDRCSPEVARPQTSSGAPKASGPKASGAKAPAAAKIPTSALGRFRRFVVDSSDDDSDDGCAPSPPPAAASPKVDAPPDKSPSPQSTPLPPVEAPAPEVAVAEAAPPPLPLSPPPPPPPPAAASAEEAPLSLAVPPSPAPVPLQAPAHGAIPADVSLPVAEAEAEAADDAETSRARPADGSVWSRSPEEVALDCPVDACVRRLQEECGRTTPRVLMTPEAEEAAAGLMARCVKLAAWECVHDVEALVELLLERYEEKCRGDDCLQADSVREVFEHFLDDRAAREDAQAQPAAPERTPPVNAEGAVALHWRAMGRVLWYNADCAAVYVPAGICRLYCAVGAIEEAVEEEREAARPVLLWVEGKAEAEAVAATMERLEASVPAVQGRWHVVNLEAVEQNRKQLPKEETDYEDEDSYFDDLTEEQSTCLKPMGRHSYVLNEWLCNPLIVVGEKSRLESETRATLRVSLSHVEGRKAMFLPPGSKTVASEHLGSFFGLHQCTGFACDRFVVRGREEAWQAPASPLCLTVTIHVPWPSQDAAKAKATVACIRGMFLSSYIREDRELWAAFSARSDDTDTRALVSSIGKAQRYALTYPGLFDRGMAKRLEEGLLAATKLKITTEGHPDTLTEGSVLVASSNFDNFGDYPHIRDQIESQKTGYVGRHTYVGDPSSSQKMKYQAYSSAVMVISPDDDIDADCLRRVLGMLAPPAATRPQLNLLCSTSACHVPPRCKGYCLPKNLPELRASKEFQSQLQLTSDAVRILHSITACRL
eukprot:Rhum_TRINITY_DN8045_c0_g1::Rhum_TRINITY_DN8045_c0_g1_i1::g.25725::m.25725